MTRIWGSLLAFLLLVCAQSAQAQQNATCHGHFPNPITDVC